MKGTFRDLMDHIGPEKLDEVIEGGKGLSEIETWLKLCDRNLPCSGFFLKSRSAQPIRQSLCPPRCARGTEELEKRSCTE